MKRLLLVTTLAALAAATTVTTAWAGTVSVTDPAGDTGSRSDIRRVTVEHMHATDRLRIATKLTKVVLGVELDIYIDSRPQNAGPEWKILAYPDSEWVLRRVSGWNDHGVNKTTCGRVRYSVDTERPVAVAGLPAGCLNLHRDVAVSVRIHDVGHGNDWAPSRRTFLPAV